MATLTFIEGFEHGAASANGGGLLAPTGDPTISSDVKRSGNYSMRCYKTESAACYGTRNVSGSPTILVARLYFRFATLPAGDTTLFRILTTLGSLGSIGFVQATGIWRAACYNVTQNGPAISVDTWYRVDLRFNVSADPWTLDWQIDGVAQTQASAVRDASTIALANIGSYMASTYDIFVDDIAFSSTSGDYPLGAGCVIGLSPNADGTHNAGTNVMEDQDGADIGVVTAYNLLDDVPMDSTTDYVKQVASGDENYAEVAFADTSKADVYGAMAYLAYHASGTGANNGQTRIIDGADQETTIYSGDMSETSLFYKSAIITAPVAGWSRTTLNALKGRVGYSTDVDAVPYWDALMIQAATGEDEYEPEGENIIKIINE